MSEPGPIVRRRVVVHGRVQGVFFRASVRDTAQRLGVTGTVRNCADGTVEAAFEGPTEDVERAVEFCRHGPPGARVEDVEVFDEQPHGEIGFRVT